MSYHSNLLKSKEYQEEIDILSRELLNQIGEYTNVLITGGTGTIGSEQVDAIMWANEHYNANIDIYVQSRTEGKAEDMFSNYKDNKLFHSVVKDIKEGIPEGIKFDAIFHLASNADPKTYKEYPEDTREIIIKGTQNVLDYAKEHPDCRVVVASSMEIYGKQPNGHDIKETDVKGLGLDYYNVRDWCYSLAKLDMEKDIEKAVANGADVKIAVIPYAFGATHAKGNSLAINNWLDSARDGETVEVKNPKATITTRRYEPVANCLQMMGYILNGTAGETYNIASLGEGTTFDKMASYCAKAGNCEFILAKQDDLDYTQKALVSNCLNGEKTFELVSMLNNAEGKEFRGYIYDNVEEAVQKTVNIEKEADLAFSKEKDISLEKE